MNLQDRIYILDGATGTALQQFRLTEADFRGEEFARHPIPLKGNNAEHYSPRRDSPGTSKLH